MKRLLLGVLGLSALSTPAIAVVEDDTYEAFEGIECKNLYNISRNYSSTEFLATPAAEFNNKTRSMIVKDGKLYIAHSRTIIKDEESNDYAHLIVYDQKTGAFEGQVQLTVAGEPITGLLCANQVGVDDFGNVWLMGLCGTTEKTPWRLYHVKDLATGDTELVAELTLPAEESIAYGRHDYYDLVGDVTGKEAGTVIMSPVASGKSTFVVGFEREQGSDQWGPHMTGCEYYAQDMPETYPAGLTTWDGAPQIRILRDESHSGGIYYVDPFVGYPALYDTEGALLDSFAAQLDVIDGVNMNANGMNEFEMAGKNFAVIAKTDYDKGVGSQVRVIRLGEGAAFSGSAIAWDLPAKGLGTLTDTGSRMFGICPDVVTDENGKQGCYLSLYKCNNGLATYLISEPGFKAGVNDIVADHDANAPVEMYNLNGVRVDGDAAPGLYLLRQGSTVTKVVIK